MRLGQSIVAGGERDTRKVVHAMSQLIEQEPLARIDYVDAVDAITMDPVNAIDGDVLFAMAVYIGTTRLIDNFLVEA